MPTVLSLMRASSLGLMAFSIAMAAEPVEKLALSTSEVNLLEVAVSSPAATPLLAAIYSGSSSDPLGREGLAWVTAKLIARQAGAEIGVTITREMTLFNITEQTGRGSIARALSRAMLKPAFSAETLEQIRKEALSEIESIRHDPIRLATEAFFAFIHAGHPYGHPSSGTTSGLEKITVDDALAFQSAHYLKGNFAIAMAGGSGEQMLAGLRSDFDAIPDGEPTRDEQVVTFLPRPAFLVVESENAPPGGIILVGHPSYVTVAHPDYFSLRAALMGVVEHAGDLLPSSVRQPAIVLSTGTLPDSSVPALAALLVRVQEIASKGLPADRLEAIKAAMRVSTDTPSGSGYSPLLFRLEEFLARTPGMTARQDALVGQITEESVRSAAARHLFAGRVAILALVRSADRFVDEVLASPAMGETGVALLGAGPVRNDFRMVKEADLFK